MQIAPQTLPDHLAISRCRHGTMLYSTRDHYVGGSLAKYGEFSTGEVDLFGQMLRPGDTVVEVGANIGAHTVALAQLVGPTGTVHAFEPQRIIFQMLCANVSLNGLTNVHTVQAGLAAAPGNLQVPPQDYAGPGNFGGISLSPGQGETVALRTLDELALPALRLLKIDVEGMESEVLRGAADTIKRLRPFLYVENDRDAKSAALIRQIFELDYRLWWHLPRMFNPGNFRGVAENIFGPVISINMVGVPRERAVRNDMHEITDENANWRTL